MFRHRSRRATAPALLAAGLIFCGSVLVAPAAAVPPVVDQYTEQPPTPGNSGSGGGGQGDSSGGSGAAGPGGSSGNSGGGSGDSGGGSVMAPPTSGAAPPEAVTPDTPAQADPGAGGGGASQGDRPGQAGSSPGNRSPGGSTVPAIAEPVGESAVEAEPADPAASMGLLFPLALMLIVGVGVAAVLSRRRPGTQTAQG